MKGLRPHLPAALLLPVLWIMAGSPSLAQDSDVFDLFKPQLILSGESSGIRSFQEDANSLVDPETDEFRWQSMNLNLHIPLGGARLHRGGRLLGHQLFAHATSSASKAEISFLPDGEADLFSGAVGFTALMLGPSHNLYAASFFASIAEDEESLEEPEIRYTGMGLGSFRKGAALWIYGGALTYNLGRPLVLPLFGGWGRVSERWTLAGIVPFLFQARYQPAPTWSLTLFLKIMGNQYRFENPEDPSTGAPTFDMQDEDLQLRIVQGRMGGALSWTFSNHFTLVGEMGGLFARKAIFADNDDRFLTAEADPGGYARLMLRFSFGDSLLDDLP